jgi:sulfur carrier protein ThiS
MSEEEYIINHKRTMQITEQTKIKDLIPEGYEVKSYIVSNNGVYVDFVLKEKTFEDCVEDTEKHNTYVCPQCKEPLVGRISVLGDYLYCRKCEDAFTLGYIQAYWGFDSLGT